MIFTVDVGNTNIVLGAFENDKLKFTARVATEALKMEDQYAIEFSSIIRLNGYKPSQVDGAILSTVVPTLVPILKRAMTKLFKCKVFVIGPGIKTGLNIKIDNPAALGSDLVCSAVGALLKHKPPLIIFDLGTATTITAVNEKCEMIGGSIMPGVRISLDALSSRTSQLPQISIDMPNENVIGANTIDCMKSGVVIGASAMMEGMIDRYKEVLGEKTTVIATGGLAGGIVAHCRREVMIEDTLLLDGLYAIYKKNTVD
ncbi:MAG: type III pantothenate kinase [Clostridiales bacterium]|nr:type III pantothenate kinase [Clostridiales bacterium]